MEMLDEEINNYKRRQLDELLNQCTPTQQTFFHHIYEKHLCGGKIHDDDLGSAIALVQRTIQSNEENKNL
jgi:hypothetical protein